MSRIVGVLVAVATAPVVALVLIIKFLEDHSSPIYVSDRIGLGGVPFSLYKVRTMIVGADVNGVDTTVSGDHRVTSVGWFLRHWKLDELPQFWNIALGDMAIVGPRPNVPREVSKYSPEELKLLTVKPGVTDLASIVFADLANALVGATEANAAYETQVRPIKSAVALLGLERRSWLLSVRIVYLTALGLVRRRKAIERACALIAALGYSELADRARSVAVR